MKNIIFFLLFSFVLIAQVKRSNKVNLSFGTILFQDTTLTLNLNVDEWKFITNNTNDLWDASCKYKCFIQNDTLIVQRPGSYQIETTLSFTGNITAFFEAAFEVNGELYNGKRWRYEPPMPNKEYTSSFNTQMFLKKGDKIRMLVRNTADNTDITFTSVIISFSKIDIKT